MASRSRNQRTSMKIAFVGGFALNPKGTMRARAHPLASELVRVGHDVTMFLPPYDNPRDSGREWEEEGVRIRNMGATAQEAQRSWLPKREYPRLLVRLIQEVTRYQPDLIHIFKPKGFAGAAGTYFLWRKIPLVLDCDDWEGWGGWNDTKPYPWIVKEYIHRQERWLIRRARAITVASYALENRAKELRGRDAGIYYLPNCGPPPSGREAQALVRAQRSSETRKDLRLREGPVLLYSGHAGDEQSVSALCRIVSRAVGERGATFVVVGDVAAPGPAERLLCMSANVELRQFPQLSYADFLRVVWASDIALFPYCDDAIHRAKCSARIVDYMAMGKPVLTTAVGQNPEYIVGGESGVLVPAGDERKFTFELKQLISDPERRRRLGANAEARIAEHFRWDGAALQECLKAYDYVRREHGDVGQVAPAEDISQFRPEQPSTREKRAG